MVFGNCSSDPYRSNFPQHFEEMVRFPARRIAQSSIFDAQLLLRPSCRSERKIPKILGGHPGQ